MKEQILALREKGYSYREIEAELGCSRSTISYHVGAGQKAKSAARLKELRGSNPLLKKMDNYKSRKGLYNKIHAFNKKDDALANCNQNFSLEDLVNHIGSEPKCYLTGMPIDLNDPASYSFDHIIPASKGGLNTLNNLGITLKTVNDMKSALSKDEFIAMCKSVVEYNT